MAEPAQTIGTVATTSGPMVAAGVWTLVGTVTIGLVTALFRFLPIWKKLGMAQDEAQSLRDVKEAQRLNARIDRIEKELRIEREMRVQSQMQASYLIAAFGMLASELERESPGNPVLKQARDLIAQATHKDSMVGDLIGALDKVADADPAE